MHFTTLKTLKSHTKTLKICPYMFVSFETILRGFMAVLHYVTELEG
jgi:hypothetical protein